MRRCDTTGLPSPGVRAAVWASGLWTALPLAPPATLNPAAFDTAQTDLWKWYLEWSQVARIAITSKPILRTLGFGKPRRASASDESTDDLDEDVSEPVQPVQPALVPA